MYKPNVKSKILKNHNICQERPPQNMDNVSHFSKCPKPTHVYIQVTQPSSGCSNWDSCPSVAEVEVRWSD